MAALALLACGRSPLVKCNPPLFDETQTVYKKRITKLNAKIYKKRYPKRHQNGSKMAHQIHPGSSKMVPERLTIIGETLFGDPLGFPSDPFGAQSDPWGAPRYPLGTPRGPSRPKKQVPEGRSDLSGDPKSPSGCSLGPLGVAAVVVVVVFLLPSLLLYCPCCCCRCRLFFVAVLSFIAMICSSLPRALDSTTHRHDSSQNRAGGMRGAIE